MLSTCVWLWVRAWKSGETELPPPTSNSTNKGFLASHRPTSFSLHTRWGVEQSRMNIPTIICRCHIFKLKKALNLISFLCFAFHPGKVCSSRTAHHHCVSPCTSGAGVFCSHWQSSHLSVYITSIMICAPPHTHTHWFGGGKGTQYEIKGRIKDAEELSPESAEQPFGRIPETLCLQARKATGQGWGPVGLSWSNPSPQGAVEFPSCSNTHPTLFITQI